MNCLRLKKPLKTMSKEELIDITCHWMTKHNADRQYIQHTATGKFFICGTYQTDLRAFLNEVKEMDYWNALDKLKPQ